MDIECTNGKSLSYHEVLCHTPADSGVSCRYAWIAIEDPTLLDYQNAEMVLMAEPSGAARALSGRRHPVTPPCRQHAYSAPCYSAAYRRHAVLRRARPTG